MLSSISYPSYFTTRVITPIAHWIGGWEGSTAGLDVVEGGQSLFILVTEPWLSQPWPGLSTDQTLPSSSCYVAVSI